MPCACKAPRINVPENMEWGPIFWKLLHALAERAGTAPMPGLRGDETRAWVAVIGTLPKTLPCEDCRNHLAAYLTCHPFELPEDYSQINAYVRRWLYDLHESVNERLGKQSYDFATLSTIYRPVKLKPTFDILQVLMKRSIQGSALPLISWHSWSKHIKTFNGMYN